MTTGDRLRVPVSRAPDYVRGSQDVACDIGRAGEDHVIKGRAENAWPTSDPRR